MPLIANFHLVNEELSAYFFEGSTKYGDMCTSSGDISGLFDVPEPVSCHIRRPCGFMFLSLDEGMM
ncbi:hypothetical protein ACFFV7_39680 [Nonomuraea spiralis]|uniref:Uncharacterized protein n=1 Tax=Nonomuraea spiralis TaxID=46182 RepID=A0ABV5ITG8_9ACTN|nr:hypothetical protein [Nonomuraea spiralis]GGT44989.1 hypothetical protein GCM10010176_105420 [Nonomuraea spiralis]